MKPDILKILEPYTAAGAFSPLDIHFARFMAKPVGLRCETQHLLLQSYRMSAGSRQRG
jgi:hypothetical protein